MKTLTFIVLSYVPSLWAQYPFEKYRPIEYHESKGFFEANEIFHTVFHNIMGSDDSLTVRLLTFKYDSSSIVLSTDGHISQVFTEPMFFDKYNLSSESVWVADIDGNKLLDIKIVASCMGTGSAGMNVRVIYLFQESIGTFRKLSFETKYDRNAIERDFNGDGRYEIITSDLRGYQGHTYWVFNLFNFINGQLVNVNEQYDYPLVVEMLLRDNFAPTDNLSQSERHSFTLLQPYRFDTSN